MSRYLPAGRSTVAVPAPGTGPGWWAGAPGVACDPTGGIVVAWRERHGHDGFDENVIARSPDGERLEEVLRLPAAHFDARWIERPALVPLPGGRWRLYVCLGYRGTKRWDIRVLEAGSLERLRDAPSVCTLWFGDELAVKDPVVIPPAAPGGRWTAVVCGHPLDIEGAEDRMVSWLASSDDGLAWRYDRVLLRGAPGAWDQRGARFTSWLPDGTAAYDGRASAEENWFERCGIASRGDDGSLVPAPAPAADIRYLTALEVPGGTRLWWEQRRPDESHELRTELLPVR